MYDKRGTLTCHESLLALKTCRGSFGATYVVLAAVKALGLVLAKNQAH